MLGKHAKGSDAEMPELNENGNPPGSGVDEFWYWGGISSAQLLWAISSYRKGYAGDGRLMPLKALGLASLFVGAAASATVGCFRASGIRSADNIRMLGADMRAALGISRRAREE